MISRCADYSLLFGFCRKMFRVSELRAMLFSSQCLVWVIFRGGFWGSWHTSDASRISKHPDIFINLSEQVHSVPNELYFLYCSGQKRVNDTASLSNTLLLHFLLQRMPTMREPRKPCSLLVYSAIFLIHIL